MPKQKKSVDQDAVISKTKTFEDCEAGSPQSMDSSPIRADETPIVSRGKKRQTEGDGEEFGQEMQKMLECFGGEFHTDGRSQSHLISFISMHKETMESCCTDISKTLVAKRRRLEQLTQSSLRNSNKKVEDIWKGQQVERHKLQDEYTRQVGSVFTQWEQDVEKTKEQEEKLNNLLKQQQKLFQQARIVQSQRLKTLKQLHEQFSKGLEELDKCHLTQHSNVQSELKKEMALLQKKLLMDTQQQEMASVRKSLQTMLF